MRVVGFLLHSVFWKKDTMSYSGYKTDSKGQSWEQLWIIAWVQNTASTSIPLHFHCLFSGVAGPSHKTEALLETPQPEEFSCGFRALYVFRGHWPRCTLFSTTHWRTPKHWQPLQFLLIHECSLPFLVLLLLFYGQGKGKTEMHQQFLSNQCCNLECTDLHTCNVSSLRLLAVTLKFRLPSPLLRSPGRQVILGQNIRQ